MANYILVDSLNMFFRAKHVGGGKDIDMRVGMAMHIMFNSVRKAWRDFNGDHVVFCLEGRSWRKDFYPPYKANRKVTADKRSPREIEDDELFFEAYDEMVKYLTIRLMLVLFVVLMLKQMILLLHGYKHILTITILLLALTATFISY